jgi:hypothetical protein
MPIELDRQFVECREQEDQSDPNLFAAFGDATGTLSWADILARRRVVVLAEAGSGKTTEMKARAQQQAAAGNAAFYATIEDVSRTGVAGALRPPDRSKFAEWRSSDTEAWLFIDSVDEAKQAGIKLRTALHAIAESIAGAERRAYIVLSGRYTDWQFRRDLIHFKEELGIPADESLPPPPTPDELIISTIHRDRREPPSPPEDAIVVVMTGLNEDRVRQFAAGKVVLNLDSFIAQIATANLWQFARRPLDLDWLVQFWHSHKRLGNLAEMLDICIAERLQESNLDRARLDGLEVTRAYQALERIGAALVFSHCETVAIPDAEISLADATNAIDIADVLPDWSPQDRELLLTRAMFDPATFGRARIHNDNQGVVRSYLTARWLHRLRKVNLSQQGLLDLLFAKTYGLAVIKPSMHQVAAWLSLSDESVAQEVLRREPYLLLDAGDPASLSRKCRENLLTTAVERLVAGDDLPSLDPDSLKRFSRPDLADAIRKLWKTHSTHPNAKRLLLRVIWLGAIGACADIVESAALGPIDADRRISVFAGRALLATGADESKRRYAKYIKSNCGELSTTVVWDTIDELAPTILGIDDVLEILSCIDVTDRDGGLGLDWHGPNLVERITSRTDVERLLLGLLSHMGGTVAAVDREETMIEKAYFPMIAAAAKKLLELSSDNEAPVTALDAAIRLGERHRRSPTMRGTRDNLTSELQKSAARRRLAFWRSAKRFADHQSLEEHPIDSLWDLRMLGFSVELTEEDIDWLLADAPLRDAASERQLAINTAMAIRRDLKLGQEAADRIRATASGDTAMIEALNSWTRPRPQSPEQAGSESRLQEIQRRNAVERAAQDRSWIEFGAKLRKNPNLMKEIRPTSPKGADSKLFHLWHLLSQAMGSDHRYALETVEPLMPMIGVEATEGFRVGLIAHWRAWPPWLRSARKNEELSRMRSLDCMGIAGITLEYVSTPGWARGLSIDDAAHAAGYATLELSGLPRWLADLAHAQPDAVRAVMAAEIEAELGRPPDAPRFGILQDLARADTVVTELMAPTVLNHLEGQPALATTFLAPMLDIVVRGLPPERERLRALATERFRTATAPAAANLYIRALFTVDGAIATETVLEKLSKLKRTEQPAFVQSMLPHVSGRQFSEDAPHISNLPLSSLEQLIRLAYATIRVEDDNVHQSGQVYSPDDRDHAESARGAAFRRLVETPGRATFDALQRLTRINDFPIPKTRLRKLAKDRAAKDSEPRAWKAGEVVAFEEAAETEPQTTRDLQLVGLRRLADMQHDLIHDDFQQGRTLASLTDERAVQNWVADRLRLKQGRSYSVEREVHVADEKEPDVRFRAKATDASVPMEIKVAESWTFPELEDALTNQLCGRYLRARESRHGILLLVHQRRKPLGWTSKAKYLTLEQVVNHLHAMAAKIAGSTWDAPQPEIAVLDVSRFAGATKKKSKIKIVRKVAAKKQKAKLPTASRPKLQAAGRAKKKP